MPQAEYEFESTLLLPGAAFLLSLLGGKDRGSAASTQGRQGRKLSQGSTLELPWRIGMPVKVGAMTTLRYKLFLF